MTYVSFKTSLQMNQIYSMLFVLFLILADKRHVIDLDYPYALPMGLTADEEGFLYTGLYNGSCIIKIDPR